MLDNYTFLDGLHSHNLLIMWFFSPCRIFEDVNIQNNNLPPKNCLITRWKCTSTPFPSLKKKNPESMNTFCWFSVKTRCQPQTQSWGEKKRNFQQRNVEKKKEKPLRVRLYMNIILQSGRWQKEENMQYFWMEKDNHTIVAHPRSRPCCFSAALNSVWARQRRLGRKTCVGSSTAAFVFELQLSGTKTA